MDNNAHSEKPVEEIFEIEDLELGEAAGGTCEAAAGCGGACARCRDGQSA